MTMTREEAIRWLISVKEEVDEYEGTMIYVSDKEADALGMAIEALSADVVSREEYDKLSDDSISEFKKLEKEYDDVIAQLNQKLENSVSREAYMEACMDAYERGLKAQVVDLTDRQTGEWIFEETDEYKRTYCSVCGGSAPFICVSDDYYGRRSHGETRKTDFCPNCGADMRGEEE